MNDFDIYDEHIKAYKEYLLAMAREHRKSQEAFNSAGVCWGMSNGTYHARSAHYYEQEAKRLSV